MARVTNFTEFFGTTVEAPGTIGAGQPVGWDGNLCSADKKARGIAMHDVTSGDGGTLHVGTGIFQVIGDGTIAIGDAVKVRAVSAGGAYFATCSEADAASIAKIAGRALTASGVDGTKFMLWIFPSQ